MTDPSVPPPLPGGRACDRPAGIRFGWPAAVRALAVLNIVLGLRGLLAALFNAAMLSIDNVAWRPHDFHLLVYESRSFAVYLRGMQVTFVVEAVLSIGLLVAGICLLRSRPAGRSLSIRCSYLQIILQLAWLTIWIRFMYLAVTRDKVLAGFRDPFLAMLYPIVLLIFMNLRPTRKLLAPQGGGHD